MEEWGIVYEAFYQILIKRKEDCGESLLVAACGDTTMGGVACFKHNSPAEVSVFRKSRPQILGRIFLLFSLNLNDYLIKKTNKKKKQLLNLGSFLFDK